MACFKIKNCIQGWILAAFWFAGLITLGATKRGFKFTVSVVPWWCNKIYMNQSPSWVNRVSKGEEGADIRTPDWQILLALYRKAYHTFCHLNWIFLAANLSSRTTSARQGIRSSNDISDLTHKQLWNLTPRNSSCSWLRSGFGSWLVVLLSNTFKRYRSWQTYHFHDVPIFISPCWDMTIMSIWAPYLTSLLCVSSQASETMVYRPLMSK